MGYKNGYKLKYYSFQGWGVCEQKVDIGSCGSSETAQLITEPKVFSKEMKCKSRPTP